MWINPRSNLHGGGSHPVSYGEGHSTHNSRLLKLAEIALSCNTPLRLKARAAEDRAHPAVHEVATLRIKLAS
jgi:hypothetical protein